MLSYRHAYHAGNHADVLKHLCLLALLERLTLKPKPLCYFETHAGAGRYRGDSAAADKTGEHAEGAGRLLDHRAQNALLARYLRLLHDTQPDYPGSPLLACAALREDDVVQLCELHPQDAPALRTSLRHEPRAHVHQRDGHEAARALIPPAQKRGLVLIDPAYELKSEYAQCVATIEHLRTHFRAACLALWYPRLPRAPAQPMLDKIMALAAADCLHITLDVREPLGDYGMYGSGMLIIQPPWQLEELVQPALHEAARALSPTAVVSIKRITP